MDTTDVALVSAARSGDPDAFSELYRRYRALVAAIVSDRVSDPELRRDVLQEVFTKALESLADLREAASFRPWLSSIARRAAIDGGRRAARLVPLADADESIADPAPGPEEIADLVQLSAVFDAAVLELSTRDAMVVSMARLGFSPLDMAGPLGISPGAAKVALHRARRRLQKVAVMGSLISGLQQEVCATPPAVTLTSPTDLLPASTR